MEISAQLASQSYGAAKSSTQPDPTKALSDPLEEFTAILEKGEAVSKQAVGGGADPHALVQALAQSELAVQSVVSVRDKVVEAYQEILRMPV